MVCAGSFGFGLARNSVALRAGEVPPGADDTSSGQTEAHVTA